MFLSAAVLGGAVALVMPPLTRETPFGVVCLVLPLRTVVAVDLTVVDVPLPAAGATVDEGVVAPVDDGAAPVVVVDSSWAAVVFVVFDADLPPPHAAATSPISAMETMSARRCMSRPPLAVVRCGRDAQESQAVVGQYQLLLVLRDAEEVGPDGAP